MVATDFDETLTRHDTVVPFMRRVAGPLPFAAGLLRRLPRLLAAMARRDRNAMRAVGTGAAFTGRDAAAVDEVGRAHGAAILAGGLRPDAVARIRWHVAEGHRVVIVSASYEQYLRVVAEALGAEGVCGTRLAVSGGQCTGRLLGPNCRGAEKVARLDAWLAGHGLDRDGVTLWAYGDSAGDRELLAVADHPVWVGAEPLDPRPSG
ncbi:MAG: HAD-IB family hydrolase [Thermoleophilia bacterium]|nr:HAD-IB family hydrolase [Thermoleophilia bacterium]